MGQERSFDGRPAAGTESLAVHREEDIRRTLFRTHLSKGSNCVYLPGAYRSHIGRRCVSNLYGREPQGLQVFQLGPDRSHDRNLEAVEDSCHAERRDHEQVETSQPKPTKPRWDTSLNPITVSGEAWLRGLGGVRGLMTWCAGGAVRFTELGVSAFRNGRASNVDTVGAAPDDSFTIAMAKRN